MEAIRRWYIIRMKRVFVFIAEVLQALIGVVIVDKGMGDSPLFSCMTASVGWVNQY